MMLGQVSHGACSERSPLGSFVLEPGYSTAWRTGAQVAQVSIVVVSPLVV